MVTQHILCTFSKSLISLGYIVNTQGQRSERWVLASSLEKDLHSLSDLFLLNPEIAESMGDEKIRIAMSKLLLKEDVHITDIL
ncbi:hypothetical protein V757_03315 [Pelistega indica]|uniref:Uncharacterized protein n=1 Tax=Pelistega indica TaxID=1414851 RepID=V8GA86_9BURK|nr:hypothetical protein [Pelistega indica]ETD72597.1 hypothetical protein V757_03315 [Pelistega indica]